MKFIGRGKSHFFWFLLLHLEKNLLHLGKKKILFIFFYFFFFKFSKNGFLQATQISQIKKKSNSKESQTTSPSVSGTRTKGFFFFFFGGGGGVLNSSKSIMS